MRPTPVSALARKHHRPYVPTPRDLALVAGEGEVAALVAPEGVLTARISPRAHAPHSAVLELVQGVYEAFPGRARAILRQRILTSAPPRLLDRAVVQVAAKRLTAGLSPGGPPSASARPRGPSLAAPDPVARHEGVRGALPRDMGAWARQARQRARREGLPDGPTRLGAVSGRWTDELCQLRAHWEAEAARDRVDLPRHRRDRAVLAALLAPDGAVLGLARNTAGRNRSLHAEVNLVQTWWHRTERPLPDGAVVVVTLQCCRMCAALLARAAAGQLTVLYAEPDPGSLARGTALQDGGPAREQHVPPG